QRFAVAHRAIPGSFRHGIRGFYYAVEDRSGRRTDAADPVARRVLPPSVTARAATVLRREIALGSRTLCPLDCPAGLLGNLLHGRYLPRQVQPLQLGAEMVGMDLHRRYALDRRTEPPRPIARLPLGHRRLPRPDLRLCGRV